MCSIFHEKPAQSSSWIVHSSHGYYTGTYMEHYRDYKIRTKEKKAEKIFNIVFLKHKYLSHPTVTPSDAVVKSLKDLGKAL